MTTVEAEHAFKVHCAGKSCRELYFTACRQRHIRSNALLLYSLESVPDLFDMTEVSAAGNYLGPVGVDALADVLRVNTMLCALRLPNVGVNDANVAMICDALRGHERVFELDLSGNLDVTNACANALFTLVDECRMLSHIRLEGTAISKAMQRKLSALAYRNEMLEANFFRADYIHLKRLFCELDSTGSGQISVGALLAQIEIPQIAAALERRFTKLDRGEDGATFDGFIDVSEFMYFTYPGFKNIDFLEAHMLREDKDEETIIANWAVLDATFKKARVVFTQFHLARFYVKRLSEEDAVHLVAQCVEQEWKRDGEPERNADGWLVLSGVSVTRGIKHVYGTEIDAEQRARDKAWDGFKLTPGTIRAMAKAFGNLRVGGVRQAEAELGKLLATPLDMETLTLQLAAARARLQGGGLGGSITVVFSEWCAFVNENHEWLLYGARKA